MSAAPSVILQRVRIEDFRCIEHADLTFDQRVTKITGNNGAGKTSVLEAIFFSIRGRSFRQPRVERLVRHTRQTFRLYGELEMAGRLSKVGVEAGRGQQRIRIDGKDETNLASINQHVVVEVIEPEIHRLVAEGPDRRRRYIDYGVFHVEQAYLGAWQRYRKVLKQRNAALKTHQDVAIWDSALIEAASVVDSFRSGYVQMLRNPVNETSAALGLDAIAIEYRPGWNDALSMAEALAASRERDQQQGITNVGPHRGDLKITWHGRLAREQVSRGQQKLLAASLVLAQTRLLADLNRGQAILLVDDPAAELDRDSMDRLMASIDVLPAQLVITALDADAISTSKDAARFHVERGSVVRQ